MRGMNRAPAMEAPHYAACRVGSATFTIVGTNVAVQLGDPNFDPQKTRLVHVECYLSDNADGSTLTATAPDTVAIGTNGVILASLTAVKAFKVLANSDNKFDLTIAKSGGHNYYLVVCLPTGTIVVSGVIAAT